MLRTSENPEQAGLWHEAFPVPIVAGSYLGSRHRPLGMLCKTVKEVSPR
jgi:hypothetical protein